jgi:hypothetical protein
MKFIAAVKSFIAQDFGQSKEREKKFSNILRQGLFYKTATCNSA